MKGEIIIFIGLATSKLKISVPVGERKGEARFLGNISSESASVAVMVRKFDRRGAKLHFCIRRVRRVTGFTARSLSWGPCKLWLRRPCEMQGATGFVYSPHKLGETHTKGDRSSQQ